VANRSTQVAGSKDARREESPCRVLVVDRDAAVAELLTRCRLAGRAVQAVHAATLAEARQQLSAAAFPLMLVQPKLSDGDGLDLIRLAARRGRTQTILLTDEPRYELAREAIRAGAVDMLVKPLKPEEATQRLGAALERLDRQVNTTRRVQRLRRLCKKLDQARKDVADQVDVLCNDLVVAYQELANQMQSVVQTSEFGVLVREELDLEMLIRKSLEYLVEQAGATNAALFLPSGLDEFTLGGYVNYDCASGSADVLLDHLGDVVAPKLAREDAVIHLTNNTQLDHWMGDDAAYLADSHLVAFSARHEGEVLAVTILFRDAAEPFAPGVIETVGAIGPMMGEALARIIRVHHRHLPDNDEGDFYGLDGDDEGEELPF